ncbi:hypothetical protein MF672_026115 [Actinomadura sp. ATCC 31491]|uniref:Uncharacterized protein n=1 Tax=Actinomadura luzonensis TaxID=2805427 RepID=A0ABT0FY03_9ACTN|nr:hypothetical protein [Actinomadura luzonensis]MCK2217236.1 hypothetical protein [Actinomadura luzonensis]
MEVESSICLSDLVPALRWSRPQQVAEALGDSRLPAGWWSSLPLSKALGTAGLDWICERLARLAASRWDHLPLADLLPALSVHTVDPALPGWSEATRTAVIGLGGWQRLRRLSPSDLGTPSATPEVVVTAVLREVIARIPAAPAAADRPEVTRPLQRGTAAGAGAGAGGLAEDPRSTGAFPAVGQSGPFAAQPATPGSPFPATPNAPLPAAGQSGPLPGQSGPLPGQTGPLPGQSGPFAAQGNPRPGQGTAQPGSAQPGAAQPGAQQPGAAQPGAQQPGAAQPGTTPPGLTTPGTTAPGATPSGTTTPGTTPPGATAPGPNFGQPGQNTAQPGQGGGGTSSGQPGQSSQSGPFGAQPGALPGRPGDRGTGSFPAQSGSFPAQSGSFPAQPQNGSPRQGFAGDALPQRPSPGQPAQPAGQPDRLPQRPGAARQPGRESTGSFPAFSNGPLPNGTTPNGTANGAPSPASPGGPSTGSFPAVPGADPAKAAKSSPVPFDADHAMVRVVDNLFRGLDKLELAVAVHRLFAEDPVSLRTLAHKLLVEREALSHAQRTAEERVLTWLRSSESAPVTGHMFRLTEWLGAAATEEQLIGADPAHPVMVPSLRTPLWRVLVTLMPDRRLQDGWLVVGDIHGLQARTRQLLAAAPPDADLVELMAELGIRAHSAKAWLEALPPESADPMASAPSSSQPLPRRTPGANGHHHRGGQPIPAATASSIDPSAALATLSALSGGRSNMLPNGLVAGSPATPPPPLPSPSSDPRRWQRIEVTPEHLRGGPVPVPEGYAAQLGMRPGTLLSVTGPGDNAIVLVWQGHQPVFDSLQPVLMRLNARPGDQVYVTVDGYRLEAQLTA